MSAPGAARLPRQIAFIIGNEGCERFSFYGMKNILTIFLIQFMLQREATAKANYHLFVSACYFFPLLGGFLADRFLGKYRTIFWLSLLYCAGHGCLALHEVYNARFRPVGAPPDCGPMICQNIVWFTCPPPLFRTAVRMSSGTLAMPRSSSSTLFDCSSGCLSSAAFRLVTYA